MRLISGFTMRALALRGQWSLRWRLEGVPCAVPRSRHRKRQQNRESYEGNLKELEQQLQQLVADVDLDQPLSTTEAVPTVTTEPETEPVATEERTEAVPFAVQRFKPKGTGSFFSQRSFADVGLSTELQSALETIGITQPSQIQALSLEAFGELGIEKSLLLAEQAGSGKTLAYLLPLIQKLRFEESECGRRLTKPKEPRAVIIVPTAELAAQVLDLCRSISKSCPFRTVALTGGRPWSTQTAFLNDGVDVVICTPKRLLSHLEAETMSLSQCQTMVLDEVDILLGENFDFSKSLMAVLHCVLEGTQFFLATATLPEHIYQDLMELFRDIIFIEGPGLHCTAPGVAEQLVDCSGGDIINEETGQKRKCEALWHLLQTENTGTPRSVVFCNKIETCRKVENYLKRRDPKAEAFVVLPYHSAVEPSRRSSNLKTFMRDTDTRHIVLVSTDRASRGLDTAAVSHVVLFDFPRDPSEYVRRVGRTARGAKGVGLVSVLVLGRQVRQAKRVLQKSKKGMPIHTVPQQSAR